MSERERPTIDALIEKVDSKYTLVVASAKRARELMNGKPRQIDTETNKPVSIALVELSHGRLLYERTKEGIK